MKPALHLVSKVLQSQHPVFDILGNFYHLRRVEPWRDRQDAASLSTYGHHKALYYEIDESKMYPTARLLKQYAQFDPKRAADALLDSRGCCLTPSSFLALADHSRTYDQISNCQS